MVRSPFPPPQGPIQRCEPVFIYVGLHAVQASYCNTPAEPASAGHSEEILCDRCLPVQLAASRRRRRDCVWSLSLKRQLAVASDGCRLPAGIGGLAAFLGGLEPPAGPRWRARALPVIVRAEQTASSLSRCASLLCLSSRRNPSLASPPLLRLGPIGLAAAPAQVVASNGMPRRLQVFDVPVFDVRRQLARMAGTCAKRIELRTASPERRRVPTTVRGICAFTIYVFFTPSTPF